jgi:hypothetical protein
VLSDTAVVVAAHRRQCTVDGYCFQRGRDIDSVVAVIVAPSRASAPASMHGAVHRIERCANWFTAWPVVQRACNAAGVGRDRLELKRQRTVKHLRFSGMLAVVRTSCCMHGRPNCISAVALKPCKCSSPLCRLYRAAPARIPPMMARTHTRPGRRTSHLPPTTALTGHDYYGSLLGSFWGTRSRQPGLRCIGRPDGQHDVRHLLCELGSGERR